MQLDVLREFLQRRGLELVGEYVDEGISGTKESDVPPVRWTPNEELSCS